MSLLGHFLLQQNEASDQGKSSSSTCGLDTSSQTPLPLQLFFIIAVFQNFLLDYFVFKSLASLNSLMYLLLQQGRS